MDIFPDYSGWPPLSGRRCIGTNIRSGAHIVGLRALCGRIAASGGPVADGPRSVTGNIRPCAIAACVRRARPGWMIA